jgi:hypothetical protein
MSNHMTKEIVPPPSGYIPSARSAPPGARRRFSEADSRPGTFHSLLNTSHRLCLARGHQLVGAVDVDGGNWSIQFVTNMGGNQAVAHRASFSIRSTKIAASTAGMTSMK